MTTQQSTDEAELRLMGTQLVALNAAVAATLELLDRPKRNKQGISIHADLHLMHEALKRIPPTTAGYDPVKAALLETTRHLLVDVFGITPGATGPDTRTRRRR